MPKPKKVVTKKVGPATVKKAAVKSKKTAGQSVAVNRQELDEAVTQLRPALQAHGGDLEVVAVGRDEITVRLQGACSCCPMAQVTLTQGVEKFLLKRVKGLKRVKAA